MKKDNESIKAILETGKKGEFWQELIIVINESIDRLKDKQNKDDLRDLIPEQYKLESELLKNEISCLEYLKDLPDDIISWLDKPNITDEEFDPFQKPEEF